MVHSIDADGIPRFLALGKRLNAADPLWVPPLDQVAAAELAGRNAFGAYGRMRLFLCESGGEDAGRVAAIVNPRLCDAAGAPIGQLGWFECVDDPAVAGALFDAGSAWLCDQGAREVWGPMNGGAHRTHRCMVEGFDRTPFLFEPRNPRCHPRLWETHGFCVAHRWSSYDVALDALFGALCDSLGLASTLPRVERSFTYSAGLAEDRAGILPRLHGLLDRFWEGHVGYASFDLAEFAEVFAGVLALMPDECLGLAVDRATGSDVACGFSYPDWAEEVRALGGDASGWGRWMSGPRPRRVVLHTVAALPQARRTGAAHLVIHNVIRDVLRAGFSEAVAALVTEDFHLIDRVSVPTRRYVLYARPMM